MRKVVLSGVVLPLSGPLAAYGKNVRDGVELALEVDEATREAGRPPIRIVFEDSRADPKTGLSALTKLVQVDGVRGLGRGTPGQRGPAPGAVPLRSRG